MSSELEQRLQRALAQVSPGETATEQAREAALAVVGATGRRGYRLALVAAVITAALVTAGVTLAASGTVRKAVGLGSAGGSRHAPPIPNGPLPPGSGGFAAYGGGRLWLASPGLRITGRRYSAAELSPVALNVALGVGHDLVVRRLSDGGVAWRHAAGGRVVAAAWAPIGTEIAYVVKRGGGYQLREIEGDGDHDRLLAAHVQPVTPSWRADSLAVAYADARYQVAIDDFADGRTIVIRRPRACSLIQTATVGFAPRGRLLAASIGDGNVLVADPGDGWAVCGSGVQVTGPMAPSQVTWLGGHTLLTADDQFLSVMTVDGRNLVAHAATAAAAGINGLTVSPDGREIAIGLWREGGVRVVAADVPHPGGHLVIQRVLRTLPVPSSGPYRLIWR